MKKIANILLFAMNPWTWAQQSCVEMDAVVIEQLQALETFHNCHERGACSELSSKPPAKLAAMLADVTEKDAIGEALQQQLIDSFYHFVRHAAAERWTCTFPQTARSHFAFAAPISADGRFRAYTWDMRRGNTMRFYFSLLQYQDGKGHTHLVEANPEQEKWLGSNSGFVTHIYDVDLGKHGTAYFLIEYAQGDSRSQSYSATLYRITDSKLEKLPWIQTKNENTATIRLEYDGWQNPLPQAPPFFQYDAVSNTLSFPQMLESPNHHLEMTTKRVQLRFDGQRFVMVK